MSEPVDVRLPSQLQPQQAAQSSQLQPQPQQLQPEEMISPEQHLAGVAKFYQEFRRASLAYGWFNDAISGKRRLPIFQAPTGYTLRDGSQERLEIDLMAPFAGIREPKVAEEARRRALAVHNNYYAQEYGEALQKLALYALNAWRAVSVENALPAGEDAPFDVLIQAIHEAYAEFEPRWETAKAVDDGLALNSVAKLSGVIDVDLTELLTAANVAPEQQRQVLQQILGPKLAALKTDLQPCLKRMAVAAAMAVEKINKRNQGT